MKQKTKNNKTNIRLLFIVIMSLLFCLAFFIVYKKNMPNSSSILSTVTPINELRRTYTARNMDIAFEVSSEYVIEDRWNFISLKKDGQEILVNGIGTNEDSLNSYLLEIPDINKEHLTINSHDVIRVYSQGRMTYFFYKDNWVISITTDFSNLYPEMDRVAQSLRFTH